MRHLAYLHGIFPGRQSNGAGTASERFLESGFGNGSRTHDFGQRRGGFDVSERDGNPVDAFRGDRFRRGFGTSTRLTDAAHDVLFVAIRRLVRLVR